MKLLSVNMTLDPVSGGGSAARTLQSTRALTAAGVECSIATSDDGLDVRITELLQGVTLVTLPTLGGRFRVPRARYGRLRTAVREADVVLLVNHWTAINVLAWRYALDAGVPYAVCPAGALPLDGGRSPLLKQVYNAVAGRSIIASADAHIAVTAHERSQFRPYGIDPDSVTVIPNGMPQPVVGDGPAFRARHRLGDAPMLMFLGRLAPIKGPDLLLSAFAHCAADRPEWHLVLAGPDDGMLLELKARVTELRLNDRVHFVGFLDEVTKPDALAAANLVVVPSRREAMSIVVLEAAGAGRPVLITDQCGVPDVEESGSGWVVEPTAEALAAGLIEATRDLAELTARGEVWRRVALSNYAWSHVAKLYIDLFSAVIRNHQGR